MNYFCVCFVGSEEVSPMVELIGVDGGSEIKYTIVMSYGIRDGKLDEYPLGEWVFGSETRSYVSSSVGFSDRGI